MRTSFVRHLYFTVVTLVTLAMMVTSLGYIISVGFDSWVFVRTAEEKNIGVPPLLYIGEFASPETQEITCTESCPFSDEEMQAIAVWKQDYANWQKQSEKTFDARGLVNALSFFIVSTPLFFLHYRILRREYFNLKESENASGVFSIYYYIASLGTLVVAVVFVAMLINTTLRTWIITDAQQDQQVFMNTPISKTETVYINAIIDCPEQCGVSEEDVAIATQWKKDYQDQYVKPYIDSWKQDFSNSLAAILVTIPVFLYHWMFIRRESKKNKFVEPPQI